jgi:hypothetical protein
LAFFSKTDVMINFVNNLALFWVKNANFFADFFCENIHKSQHRSQNERNFVFFQLFRYLFHCMCICTSGIYIKETVVYQIWEPCELNYILCNFGGHWRFLFHKKVRPHCLVWTHFAMRNYAYENEHFSRYLLHGQKDSHF